MNLRLFDSISNIVPWCRNNNLSTKLPKINSNILLISPQKKSIEQINCVREPIISVQEQRRTREKISSSIKCKSKYTDKCYAEYNIIGLRQGFGLLKDIRHEKLESGKPSLVIHSATLEKNVTDTSISTNYALKELENVELRKRFAIVHTEKYIYIVGGYDVLGNRSIIHGEHLILHYPQDKQWQYAPELNIVRVRPLVFVDPNDTIHGHNVYVAGGFNINPHTHKPYIVADLQLFNQITQSWQQLTTIPNLESSHELSFDDDKLYVNEIIELPDQMPIINNLCSFDLRKLSWMNTTNDIDDNRKINAQNSMKKTSSTSPFFLSPDKNKNKEIKTKQNEKVINLI
ncbi:unnamed protein product [Rotaria sp. Silwood1]|nr:unnamed protein product [Rotaria sp. Silwood1]